MDLLLVLGLEEGLVECATLSLKVWSYYATVIEYKKVTFYPMVFKLGAVHKRRRKFLAFFDPWHLPLIWKHIKFSMTPP